MNRRQFVTALVVGGGCGGLVSCAGHMAPPRPAGPVALGRKPGDFAEGVEARWAEADGFFIVRRGDSLSAVSVQCTHRKCEVEASAEKGLECPCHGSRFDAEGHVLKGPAKRALSHFAISTDEQGNVVVDPRREFTEAEWGSAGSELRVGR